jgi:hypothetical protein
VPSRIEHVKTWLINNICDFQGYGSEYQESGLVLCDAVRPDTGLPALCSNIALPCTGLNLKAISFPNVRFSQRLCLGFRSSGDAGGDTSSQRATVISPTLLAIFYQATRRHMHRTPLP